MGRSIVGTGTSGDLVLDTNEVGYDISGNWSDIDWALYLVERNTSNTTWSGGGISFSVGQHNVQEWASGTFGFDWRPGGNQTVLIASGRNRVGHDGNGGGTVTVGATIGSTGTSAAGGPTSIQNSLDMTLLRQPPGTPYDLSATRVSDSQVRISYTNTWGTNGNPAQNQVEIEGVPSGGNTVMTFDAVNQINVAILANEKKRYRVRAGNSAGWSAWSAWTSYIYTTPAAPSNVQAAKNSGTGIVVTFDSNVQYGEFNHEVWHGIRNTDGTLTWDNGPITTLSSTARSYTHTNPDLSKVHRYSVRAKQGSLYSGYMESNDVKLAAPPSKPTMIAQPGTTDRGTTTTFTWKHNSTDTSPQTAYELRRNWNGGAPSAGATTGKVSGNDNTWTIGANNANSSVSVQVRTWGQATTGGSDGTGASEWSDIQTVQIRNIPTTSITSPTQNQVINSASVRANISFAQDEGAFFVQAQMELRRGTSSTSPLVESLSVMNTQGIEFDTALSNGQSYVIRARVKDSNGLWSAWAARLFSVSFLSPPVPVVTLSYLPDSGAVQVSVVFPEPASDESAPATVTITRRINGGTTEDVVRDYPINTDIAILDNTASVNGSNAYTIVATSDQGATSRVSKTLVTKELRRAFLGKGTSFSRVGVFGGNLSVDDTVSVASAVMEAAGRTKPVGLYGVETSVVVKVSSFIYEGLGSTPDFLRDLLLVPGKACYRDATGRRVFGTVKGGVSRDAQGNADRATLTFTITETS